MRRVEGDEGRRRSLVNAGRRSRRSKTLSRFMRRVEGDEGPRGSLANGARRSRRSKTPIMLRRSVRASPLPVDARLRWFTLRHDLREESKGTKDGEEALRTALEGAEGRRRPSCSVDPFEPRPSLSMLAFRWLTLRHDLREESKGTKDGEEALRTALEG